MNADFIFKIRSPNPQNSCQMLWNPPLSQPLNQALKQHHRFHIFVRDRLVASRPICRIVLDPCHPLSARANHSARSPHIAHSSRARLRHSRMDHVFDNTQPPICIPSNLPSCTHKQRRHTDIYAQIHHPASPQTGSKCNKTPSLSRKAGTMFAPQQACYFGFFFRKCRAAV